MVSTTNLFLLGLHNVYEGRVPGQPSADALVAAVSALMFRPGSNVLTHLQFEDSFCLNCDWRSINLTASSKAMPTRFTIDAESGACYSHSGRLP